MALAERTTDHIIYGLMKNAGITPYPEKCPIEEVQSALRTASKRMTGKMGKPEFIALVGNYLIVVEDKKDTSYQAKYMTDKDDTLLMDVSSVTDYAENGALHYAQHIACNSTFDKIFAFGCSGDELSGLSIRPIYVSKTGYKIMPKVKDFEEFGTPDRIETYYRTKVLQNKSEQQMELELILSRAQKLHEDLRNYGSLGENDKPQIVSAILLALCYRNFHTNQLSRTDAEQSDGEMIYNAIENHMEEVNVAPVLKKERVLAQFQFIKHRPQLSSIHPALGKSPLKYYAEYIESKVYAAICNNTPDDVLGRFYGEFLSYSGGDGKGLGIVLTPSHITQLMVDLLNIHLDDKVLDPCCGTGGFLIAAMSSMFRLAETDIASKIKRDAKIRYIKQNSLHGVEMDDRMFSIATTNMILRGDGKSNLECEDFFKLPTETLRKQKFTIGLMNPPYSQAKNSKTAHLSELSFISHLLDSLADGARCAVIVPQSTMVGKTKNDMKLKEKILSSHTLEGVITLNPQTFYPVGTNPVIAVFTAHRNHDMKKRVKFFNFKDDGFELAPHVGMVDNGTFEQKKKMLLDCWFDHEDAHSSFMVKSTVTAKDEWLHSFYYFNDEIPTDEDFEKTMADYLTFEFKMIAEGRGYLFGFNEGKKEV